MYYTRLPACTSLFHYHVCIAELDGTCRRALGISVIRVYNCISIISRLLPNGSLLRRACSFVGAASMVSMDVVHRIVESH